MSDTQAKIYWVRDGEPKGWDQQHILVPNCPGCDWSTIAVEDAKYCMECGLPTIYILCPDCNNPLQTKNKDHDAGNKFCEQCGKGVEAYISECRTMAMGATT